MNLEKINPSPGSTHRLPPHQGTGDMPLPALNPREIDSMVRRAVDRLKALSAGARVRHQLRVEAIDKGLVLVRIEGDRRLFEAVGMSAAFSPQDDAAHTQELTYLAVDGKQYAGRVLTGPNESLIDPARLDRQTASALTDAGEGSFACINGGYFNYKRFADAQAPESASIGQVTSAGVAHTHLPPPPVYDQDFHSLTFEDGSSIELAPRLSDEGCPLITKRDLAAVKYRVDPACETSVLSATIPGNLQHAAARHPRAAISLADDMRSATTRLIIGRAADRKRNPNSGYSLAEWADITARLDKLDGSPHRSSNLDGGGSAALVVIAPDGTCRRTLQNEVGRPVANLIGFVERDGDATDRAVPR